MIASKKLRVFSALFLAQICFGQKVRNIQCLGIQYNQCVCVFIAKRQKQYGGGGVGWGGHNFDFGYLLFIHLYLVLLDSYRCIILFMKPLAPNWKRDSFWSVSSPFTTHSDPGSYLNDPFIKFYKLVFNGWEIRLISALSSCMYVCVWGGI